MNNGCICCTVRGDLIRIIEGLMKRRNRFDGIIVETTGLAYPGPWRKHSLWMKMCGRNETRCNSFCCRCKAFPSEIDHAKEIIEQIAFADVVLINQGRLVSDSALLSVEARIRKNNRWPSSFDPRDAASIQVGSLIIMIQSPMNSGD